MKSMLISTISPGSFKLQYKCRQRSQIALATLTIVTVGQEQAI